MKEFLTLLSRGLTSTRGEMTQLLTLSVNKIGWKDNKFPQEYTTEYNRKQMNSSVLRIKGSQGVWFRRGRKRE